MKVRTKSGRKELPVIADVTLGLDTGVKSAVRVLQVLEFFDQIERDARVGEIVEHFGFPQSSTSALLKSLVQTGYLDYSPTTRSYMPTPRLALLGSWVGGSPIRDGNIGRMMDELSAETGEAILLACSNGIYSKYIHAVQATNVLRMHVSVGSQRFLAWSAMGVALLSDMSDDEIRLLVRRTNAEAASGKRPIDVRQTLAHIANFRKSGYFFSRGLIVPGAGMICMRLPPNAVTPDRPLAIGIGGLLASLEPQEGRLVRLMRDVISRYVSSAALKPTVRAKGKNLSRSPELARLKK